MKNNKRRDRLCGAFMGMAALLSAAGAQAACTQADLTGTWHAFGISGDVNTGYFEQTSRCKFRVNSAGTILASASACIVRDYGGNTAADVTGGSLRVSAACAITGNVNVCASGFCFGIRVQAAQMEKSKTAFPMIGYSTRNPYWLISFQAIKL